MSEEIESLADQMFRSVKGFLSKELADRDNRIAELELRIASIPAGPKGDRGPEGPPGTPGIDGVNGTHGINGRDGKDGIDGIDGLPGERGLVGELGPQGEIGKTGFDGLPGKDGQEGVDGRDGKDGGPGRDALQIEPLPEIDQEKSYHRGTWAIYRGGLIRAARTTEPIVDSLEQAGWVAEIEGIANEAEQVSEDGRELVRTTTYTSGRKWVRSETRKIQIYRGVWRQTEFKQGDTVTWDGSQWHAEKDTQTKPGMPESDWKLCVKRGQNGKDGADGLRGLQGTEGRVGRDLTQLGPNGQKF